MLSAAQARELATYAPANPILVAIEKAVRARASIGAVTVEITNLLPGWDAWAKGELPNAQLDEVRAVLNKAGYSVKVEPSTVGFRGGVRIGWES